MRKNKVILFGTNYFPEPIGIPRYTTEMAEYIVKKNIKVSVICSHPLYPEWKRFKNYKSSYLFFKKETINNVDVYRVPTFIPIKDGFFYRAIFEILFLFASLPVLLFLRLRGYSKIIVTLPPFFLGLVFLIPLFFNKKIIINKDLQIDIAKNLNIISNKYILKFLFFIEKIIFKKANHIFAVSENMKEIISSKLSKKKKIIFFPDWVDLKTLSLQSNAKINFFKKKNNFPSNKIILGYSGNIAKKQGLDLFIDLAHDLNKSHKDQIHFVIVGNGVSRKEIENYAIKRKIQNISFYDLFPEKDLATLISSIDINFVFQKNEVNDLVMPGKIFNILACKKSLIVTAPNKSSISKISIETKSFFSIPRENYKELLSVSKMLISDKDIRESMANNSEKFVKNIYDKAKVLNNFIEFIK